MKTHVPLLTALTLGGCLLLARTPAAAATLPDADAQPAVASPQSAQLTARPTPDPAPSLAAARARVGTHGPFRTSPDVPLPKHAYSPFDKLNAPPERPLLPGRDFLPGRLAIKLKPVNTAPTKSIAGLPDVAALREKFAAYGVTGLERAIRNAQPPPPKPAYAAPAAAVVAPPAEPEPPDLTRWLRATCATNLDVRELAAQLAQDPDVEIAEPDFIRRPTGYIPTGGDADPLFASQWHLPAVKAPEAWAYLDSQGLPPGGNHDIVVAVIDTGVDYNHPDLAANMWVNSQEIAGNGIDDDHNGFVDDVHGCTVVSSSSFHTGDPMDDHGHGTHVAGIIGAQAGNSNGVVGVAYNCQMMAIKAAQYSGVLATSDIAEAINYAVEKGADVINMSFGGYAKSQVEEDALAVAFGQCVLVAAAGNDGCGNECLPCARPMYPAAYSWVLGVMASQPGGAKASFSNFDCNPHNTIEYELLAPGVDVWSTLPNSQYAAWDGTSMAAPIVSGMAVLARTRFSDKDLYSSRFIMGQIAGRQEPMQNLADAYASLTTSPVPELRYLQHWLFDTTNQSAINDNDGIVDAGETVDMAIIIRNQWGKADNVVATLDAWAEGAIQPDPYVTWITSTNDYGAIGSFNWDDNGLIYGTEGEITGVRHPFRFQVSPNCPNDHLIPFRLTTVCRNGLDPEDPGVYTTTNRFLLGVQRGRELPHLVTTNQTLTSDYFWILPDGCVVSSNVTLQIEAGTQLQVYSSVPADPLRSDPNPRLLVRGRLLIQGTEQSPVQIFPSAIYPGRLTRLDEDGGEITANYAEILNPSLSATEISHCRFDSTGIWDTSYEVNGVVFDSASQNYISADTVTATSIKNQGPTGTGVGNLQGRGTAFRLNHDYLYDTAVRGRITECLLAHNFAEIWWFWWADSLSFNDNTLLLNANGRGVSRFWIDSVSPSGVQPPLWVTNNAILQNPYMLDLSRQPDFRWAITGQPQSPPPKAQFAANYWGNVSFSHIDAFVHDFFDDVSLGMVVFQPVIGAAPETCYPFVVDVTVRDSSDQATSILGPGPATFTATFNRDMATNQPQVSFGPDIPMTDYTVHPVNGGWQDSRTWVGTFNITPITGDGYQLIRIAGAVAADDPWLVTGDDTGRFRFEIITSGTESMNLQATGGEGKVDLSWMQDDFDLLAGYNLYRSTTQDGSYTRLNNGLIPAQQKSYMDTAVTPGVPYYYKFKVVKTDMTESDFSNVAQGTPLDTIPPVLTHTPLTSAAPGMPLTLTAEATDNVGVQGVTLHFRTVGAANYTTRTMTHTTGNRYAATIEGSRLVSPGVEYYIEATDGISTVRSGRPEYPWQVTVVDRPVVNVVTPNSGPASGGTFVTIAGSNFKTNATVSLGGVPAENVTVMSAHQITCITTAHFPAAVDVQVTNPDAQSGTLLRGYTYRSEVASLSLPNTGGPRYGVVQVPINAANVQGLAAASLTVTFDPAVLRAVTARTGSLTPGWYLAPGTNTSGQLRLSMASPGSTSTGSGVLAQLEFEVLGAPGATSPLALTGVSLNDGAIQTETAAGSFAVNVVYDVSGTVTFWNGGAGVPGVLCTLQGDRVYAGTSGSSGAFTVAGAAAGDYTLTPTKSDDAEGISAYDASLVLQHDAGLTTLSGRAATAADVNKSGTITAFDAFYILQKAVDLIPLPFPGAGQVWVFDPASRSYAGLSSSQSGQDFTAILLGDVSGNWTAPAALPGPTGGGEVTQMGSSAVTLALRQLVTQSSTPQVWLLLRSDDSAVYSLDLILSNRFGQGLVSLWNGALAETMAISSNTNIHGQIRVALAGALPMQGVGAVLVFAVPTDEPQGLAIVSASINEGAIPVEIDPEGAVFDEDTDGDGQTDWAEIRAGTLATDPQSYFALRDVTMESGGARRITWLSVPGKTYQLLFAEESISGPWQPLGPPVNATGQTASLIDDTMTFATGRLYRVQLVE
ncbi:MAG: S8 family serine peptidase [Verrucomicrobiae bacterium]|nr:S8 family serine peptidase [Verrucomicrobiae bacterium]